VASDQVYNSWVTRHPNGLQPGDVITVWLPPDMLISDPGDIIAPVTVRAVPGRGKDPRTVAQGQMNLSEVDDQDSLALKHEVGPGEPVVVTCTAPLINVTDSRDNPYEPHPGSASVIV
jgi:hypothetical protein